MSRSVLVRSLLVVLITTMSSLVSAQQVIRLSTTTSTENSGLLAYLLPQFEQQFHTKIQVIAVGTGKALDWQKMATSMSRWYTPDHPKINLSTQDSVSTVAMWCTTTSLWSDQ